LQICSNTRACIASPNASDVPVTFLH
jgi:hypothetical protein